MLALRGSVLSRHRLGVDISVLFRFVFLILDILRDISVFYDLCRDCVVESCSVVPLRAHVERDLQLIKVLLVKLLLRLTVGEILE